MSRQFGLAVVNLVWLSWLTYSSQFGEDGINLILTGWLIGVGYLCGLIFYGVALGQFKDVCCPPVFGFDGLWDAIVCLVSIW